MAWYYLCLAGLFEVVWTVGLKYTNGFTQLWFSAGTIAAMIASFYFLTEALTTVPVGTGYAVWTGIGAAGTAILGIVLFAESTTLPRLASSALIVTGIVRLKVNS